MAIDLPSVEQEWVANVAPYIEAMAEMVASVRAAKDESLAAIAEIQAALDALHGGDVSVGVDAAGAASSAAAMDEAAAAAAKLAAEDRLAKESADMFIESLAMEDAALSRVTAAKDESARASLLLAGADRILAGAEEDVASSAVSPSDALHGIVDAMQGAGTATRFFGLSLNALHWIVGVSAETLAVVIPAAIALGAGLDVAAQGAFNAYNHMTALWTAAESMGSTFHVTMGSALGLKDALQQAQNEANPGVYELLGSAVNDAKTGMGQLATAGLQVVHMWDEFAARITVDLKQMQASGETDALLGKMVSDLQELGQVFGNVGHAILNFAADMPGLAEVLLAIVDDISKFILWLSTLPRWLIMGAMALEEFYRWGGLAASMIARIGLLLPSLAGAPIGIAVGLFGRLAAIMGSVVGVGAQLVGGLGKLAGMIVGEDIPVLGALAGKLGATSESMAALAENTAVMGEIGLAIAAFTALAVVISRVKDANEQMASSAEKAVKAASDMQVLSTIAQQLVILGNASDHTSVSLEHMSSTMQTAGAAAIGFSATTGVGLEGVSKITAGFAQNVANGSQIINSAIPSFGGLASAAAHLWASFTGATKAESDVSTLNAAQEQIIGTFRTVTSNISYLAGAYHIAGSAAVVMAQEAGVNLQAPLRGTAQAAQIARQQIANFVQGLGAMSAPAGVVGNDMEALGIQSQLAGTKVSQLNQAWDAWMSSVTGTMADFSQVQTALQGMGADAAASSASLTGSIGSISRSASGMTYTLKGMSADAMQSWQQLTSALNQGNSALDQLRTGMAEGVVSGSEFRSTVQGLVGEFIPFVAGNKTAIDMLSNLAHEAGGPVTSSLRQLEEWAGVKGPAAANQFADGMNKASQAMGNMSQVAQNLSAVVNDQLDQALASAITKTANIIPLTDTYISDLNKYGANAWQTKAAQDALANAQARATKLTQEAGAQSVATANHMHSETVAAQTLSHYLYAIPNIQRTVTITTDNFVNTAAGAAAQELLHPNPHASGTPNAAPGLALVGENGPELLMLHGGEAIFNATETARMLSGIPSAIFGATGSYRASSAGGGGGAGGAAGGMVEVHSHVYLDGKQIYESVQEQGLKYNTRNSGSRTGKFIPGA